MPSLQSKVINVVLHVIRMKRTLNRLQQRVERGERTYTEPTRRQQKEHRVTTSDVDGHTVWTITPWNGANGNVIIYLHGGAYVNSFSPQHWTFISKLVTRLGCGVVAPNYPHAPEHCVHDTIGMMLTLYQQLAMQVGAKNITLMGDSSGGGISLALAQKAREEKLEQPGRLILLSPWLDATLSNPEIQAIDKIDPFLGVIGLTYGGKVYARDVDPKSYLVSPVYGTLQNLAPITLYIGTRDILLTDCRRLREKAAAEGASLDYREYEGMVHNWMLGPLPEARMVLDQIVAILGE